MVGLICLWFVVRFGFEVVLLVGLRLIAVGFIVVCEVPLIWLCLLCLIVCGWSVGLRVAGVVICGLAGLGVTPILWFCEFGRLVALIC